jgi:hypothetical protein
MESIGQTIVTIALPSLIDLKHELAVLWSRNATFMFREQ